MREIIKTLLNRDYNIPTLKPTLEKLLLYDDEQLNYILLNGVYISKELKIQYLDSFRCWNENTHIVGTLPVAGLIERKLNSELMKIIKS